MANLDHDIAYFSLEIGLEASIPTYSGGLGILAGDTLKAAADIELPYVGVTLLYRKGYFKQGLTDDGTQTENEVTWDPTEELTPMAPRISVPIDGREVVLRAWRLEIVGVTGHVVPVYFLDADVEENDEETRALTHRLYAGDTDHRIRQEAILGIGGRRMLRAIGHDLGCFHMNEGHACFVTVELLSEHICRTRNLQLDHDAIADVRRRCVFTTHTPVEVGHDRFAISRVKAIVGDHPLFERPDLYGTSAGEFNTTRLAMTMSKFSNAVAQRHGEVSRDMFPGFDVEAITNGVHAASWASQPMRELFDRHIPRWRGRNADLRLAMAIPRDAFWDAHQICKEDLVEHVNDAADVKFDPDVLTLVFARRMTEYKRPGLLLSDPDRLREIVRSAGRVQIIYAGKAHPHDGRGAEIIREIHGAMQSLREFVPIAFLESYDIELARKLVSGADIWLNNPRPPLEASGTSGMKAALNGVPSFSTMDGWWLEGCVEGTTGWAIGTDADDIRTDDAPQMDETHASDLYRKLESTVIPKYYNDRTGWTDMMRHCVSINGSFFTTERMVRQYAMKAYTR